MLDSVFNGSKKDEEGDTFHVNKDSVLQDTKCFDTPDRDKWLHLFTDLAILEQRGELESLTTTEKNNLFFSITKVFAKADAVVKTVALDLIDCASLRTPESFILFSSVAKCLTTDSDVVCGRAIKWIFNNVDYREVMNTNAFRQMEASLGSKDESTDYPASVIALALAKGCEDPNNLEGMRSMIGQKFRSLLNSRLTSGESYCHLPILRVLRYINSDDAMYKVIVSNRHDLSPPANVQRLRYIRRMFRRMPQRRVKMIETVSTLLGNKSEMVQLEAAKVMIDLGEEQEMAPAVRKLQDFLSSSQVCLKFAAVKQLSSLASKHPMLMGNCYLDLEGLINYSNRSIACMAIIALLQSGSEESVTPLLKQISNLLSELDDARKKTIVNAVTELKKFKSKLSEILQFLASLLREEGCADLKETVFRGMVAVMQEDPNCTETGMGHLSEFIEDCEHDDLSIKVLNFLGEHSSGVQNPSKYIRYIYNRVMLETPCVRTAAISALWSIANCSSGLREPIKGLLETSVHDNYCEVRERAALALCSLEIPDYNPDAEEGKIDLGMLEYSLCQFIKDKNYSDVFTLHHIRRKPVEIKKSVEVFEEVSVVKPKEVKVGVNYAEIFRQYEALQVYGPILRSTEEDCMVDDDDSEYLVNLIKHIHNRHVVFQFNVQNNTEDQRLSNIRIEMELSDGLEAEDFGITLAKLDVAESGSIFLACSREKDCFEGFMDAVLHFHIQDMSIDDDDQGYDDEFELSSPVSLSINDFIRPPSTFISEREFSSVWNVAQNKVSKTGKLDKNSLQDAVSSILDMVGLYPVGDSSEVDPKKQTHSLMLAGVFLASMPVYAIAKFIQRTDVIKFKVECSSDDSKVSHMIVMAIFS